MDQSPINPLVSVIVDHSPASQIAPASAIQDAKLYAFRVFGIYCLIFYCFMTRGNVRELVLIPRPSYIFGFCYVLFAFMLYR